jgi:hypothetical protein
MRDSGDYVFFVWLFVMMYCVVRMILVELGIEIDIVWSGLSVLISFCVCVCGWGFLYWRRD